MGLPNSSCETNFSSANADREIFILPVQLTADREVFIFPVHLTTSRIGNLTRLIHTLAICVTMCGGFK